MENVEANQIKILGLDSCSFGFNFSVPVWNGNDKLYKKIKFDWFLRNNNFFKKITKNLGPFFPNEKYSFFKVF